MSWVPILIGWSPDLRRWTRVSRLSWIAPMGPALWSRREALDALGHRVIPLNAQISWRFPARLPEPTPQNLADTASVVAVAGS